MRLWLDGAASGIVLCLGISFEGFLNHIFESLFQNYQPTHTVYAQDSGLLFGEFDEGFCLGIQYFLRCLVFFVKTAI